MMTMTRLSWLRAVAALVLTVVLASTVWGQASPPSPTSLQAAAAATQARIDAFNAMSEFIVARFTLEAHMQAGQRNGEKQLEKLLKGYDKALDKAASDAAKDLSTQIKSHTKALKLEGGPRRATDITDLLRQRLTEINASRASTRARLYTIMAQSLTGPTA